MNNKKFCIVANAQFKIKSVRLFQSLKYRIIALDGAFNKLLKESIYPHYIIGDMDSISNASKDQFNNFNGIVISKNNQDETDLEYAIKYLVHHYLPTDITIIGAINGARQDHMLCNLLLLKKLHHRDISISILEKYHRIEYFENQEKTICTALNRKIGFIGFKEAYITCDSVNPMYPKALEYPLDSYHLNFEKQYSVSNILLSDHIRFFIEGCAIITLPNMLQS